MIPFSHRGAGTPLGRVATVAACALVALFGAVGPAHAQSGDGYLFRAPAGAIGIRGGWAFAAAGSDVFDFVTEQHTLERGDFSSLAGAADLALTVTDRLDVVLGVGYARASADSEMREWVAEDDSPIPQTNHYTRIPVTAGLKYYVMERGRQIGRLAWVPQRYLPYFGLGAGWIRYDFEQSGEFVTEDDFIVAGSLGSDGWAPTAYLAGGLDVALTPRVVLNTEGRYNWGSATPGLDYDRFEGIDLAGVQTTVGLSLRF